MIILFSHFFITNIALTQSNALEIIYDNVIFYYFVAIITFTQTNTLKMILLVNKSVDQVPPPFHIWYKQILLETLIRNQNYKYAYIKVYELFSYMPLDFRVCLVGGRDRWMERSGGREVQGESSSLVWLEGRQKGKERWRETSSTCAHQFTFFHKQKDANSLYLSLKRQLHPKKKKY